MDSQSLTTDRRTVPADDHPTGHDLIAIDTWLPGPQPTDSDLELAAGREHPSRFWRCRACGAERNRPDEFAVPCPGGREPAVALDGGYSIEDERTHRALAADVTVEFLTFGPGYRVIEGDGTEYVVDVDAETCRCDDDVGPGNYCEHLRRADIAIRTGELPGPDGRYVR